MITLISNKNLGGYKTMKHTVVVYIKIPIWKKKQIVKFFKNFNWRSSQLHTIIRSISQKISAVCQNGSQNINTHTESSTWNVMLQEAYSYLSNKREVTLIDFENK